MTLGSRASESRKPVGVVLYMSRAVCPSCGEIVACPSCEGYKCPKCETNLPRPEMDGSREISGANCPIGSIMDLSFEDLVGGE